MHAVAGRIILYCYSTKFVQNDDVRRLTKQPKLTAIIQSRRLTLFEHIMRMGDNADAKRILLASPLADWRRQLGRPCIMWLSTVQQDLKQHHLRSPKQQIWLRTALCGGWCRRMALRNLELHARNDDDANTALGGSRPNSDWHSCIVTMTDVLNDFIKKWLTNRICCFWFRHDSCTASAHAATEVVGRISPNVAITRCSCEATDAKYTRPGDWPVLPSWEIPGVCLFAPTFTAHHARSKQRKCVYVTSYM